MLARHASLPAALVAILGAALLVAGCAKPTSAPPSTGTGGTSGSSCSTGQTKCPQSCTNVNTDSANCGACGTVCKSGQTCQSGTCTCGAGLLNCGGSCVSSNNANCGTCGTTCSSTQVCSNNTCSSSCASGTTACAGGTCANTTTDNLNCGACGTVCSGGTACTGGTCTCSVAGQQVCSGTCTDTNSNTSNCGSCGHACTSGQSCTNGTCTGGGAGTAGTSGTAGTNGAGGKGGSGGAGKGGSGGVTAVDAGTDAIVCTNTAAPTYLPIDSSGFVNEVCNTYGMQGAWYCYSDTTPTSAGMTVPGNGNSDCMNAVPPFNATAGGMCISGTTSTSSGSYGAAIGLELNTPAAVAGVNQPKQAYNASSHSIVGFEITIANEAGKTNTAGLRLYFTTAATTSVTQPFVELPGAGTYDILIGDAIVPKSFGGTSAGLTPSASSIFDIQLAIPQQPGSVGVPYGYCITKIKPITVAPAVPGSCSALQNYGNPVCGAQDLLAEVGNYGVQNNVSGTGEQCIQAKVGGTCAGFSLTYPTNTLNPAATFPASYPSIIYGWQNGAFYGGYKTPKPLSAIATIPTSWSFSAPTTASEWDVSYDTWLLPTGGSAASNPANNNGMVELMVWMNRSNFSSNGQPFPIGGSTPNDGNAVTIGSVPGTWDVYKGTLSNNGSNWTVLSYLAHGTAASSFTNVDLKAFFSDAVTNRGVGLTTASYLLGIQAGFELNGANAGAVTSFSVSAN